MIKTDQSTPTFQANLIINPSVKIKGKRFLEKGFSFLTKENPKEVLIINNANTKSANSLNLLFRDSSLKPMILNAEDFDNIHLKFFVLNTLVRSFKAMIINNKYMHHIDKLTVLKDRVLANVEKFEEKSLWYRTILDGTKEELTKSNFCSALKQARIDSCKNFIENYDILINKILVIMF